jgi:hypothetical protein
LFDSILSDTLSSKGAHTTNSHLPSFKHVAPTFNAHHLQNKVSKHDYIKVKSDY